MIKPEMVPDEVWTHVALRLESAGAVVSDQVAKLVVADALNAWPGVNTDAVRCGTLILHLPREPHNDEA